MPFGPPTPISIPFASKKRLNSKDFLNKTRRLSIVLITIPYYIFSVLLFIVCQFPLSIHLWRIIRDDPVPSQIFPIVSVGKSWDFYFWIGKGISESPVDWLLWCSKICPFFLLFVLGCCVCSFQWSVVFASNSQLIGIFRKPWTLINVEFFCLMFCVLMKVSRRVRC